MSIYIGNDLEDRLKILETENASFNKNTMITIRWCMKLIICQTYNVESSFYRQSMKIDNYLKIVEWMDSSIAQSTVIQKLDKKAYIIQPKPNTK